MPIATPQQPFDIQPSQLVAPANLQPLQQAGGIMDAFAVGAEQTRRLIEPLGKEARAKSRATIAEAQVRERVANDRVIQEAQRTVAELQGVEARQRIDAIKNAPFDARIEQQRKSAEGLAKYLETVTGQPDAAVALTRAGLEIPRDPATGIIDAAKAIPLIEGAKQWAENQRKATAFLQAPYPEQMGVVQMPDGTTKPALYNPLTKELIGTQDQLPAYLDTMRKRAGMSAKEYMAELAAKAVTQPTAPAAAPAMAAPAAAPVMAAPVATTPGALPVGSTVVKEPLKPSVKTESQNKASIYAAAMAGSEMGMDQLAKDDPNFNATSLGNQALMSLAEIRSQSPGSFEKGASLLAEWAKSDSLKTYESAMETGLLSILRQVSGAAIPHWEKDVYRKAYYPGPGDSKEVLLRKKQHRQVLLRAFEDAAGGKNPEILAAIENMQGASLAGTDWQATPDPDIAKLKFKMAVDNLTQVALKTAAVPSPLPGGKSILINGKFYQQAGPSPKTNTPAIQPLTQK